MKDKLRIGIIGPGHVTEHALQNIGDIANNLESIAFYNHGSASFEKNYEGHQRTLFKSLPEKMKKEVDVQAHEDFNNFMDNSEVLILNVGRATPALFLQNGKISPQFKELEAIVVREAQKQGPKNKLSDADFITAYHILKEFKTVQDQGYFDDPFRTLIRLPANLPAAVQYAYTMRKYFDQRKVDPRNKFLIVNANSSENNLDAILSVIPEWKDSAVSLAVDQDRLITLFNTGKDVPKLPSAVVTLGVVGDHDSYIIPVFRNLHLHLQQMEDPRRIETFKQEIKNYYLQHYQNLQQQTRRYFVENKEVENLTTDAGRGVIAILSTIMEGNSLTSGYFRDLSATRVGEKYGLKPGEGLCFVDEYKIERELGQFQIVPQPQELDDLAREEFQRCQEAHIKLHQRFIQNPLIPVHTFPGTADRHPISTAQSRVDLYGSMKRRHTEILVPILSVQGKEPRQKLVALDLSSLERREITFEGRKKNDFLRCVEIITVDKKEYIACGFAQDYVLLNPHPFGIAGGHQLLSKPREAPEENKTYRINSLAAIGERILLSHALQGLISVDSRTGEEKVLYTPKKSDGAIRKATINPYEGNIYVLVGKTIKVFSPAGELQKTFVSPDSTDLESMVFDSEHLYVSSDRNRRGNSYIYQARINEPQKKPELSRLSSNFRGDIVELRIFSQEGNTHLLYSNGGQIWLAQVEKDAQGNPTGLHSPQKFHPHKMRITGNKGGVGGLAAGVHGYVSYGFMDPRQQQALYELDLRTREHPLLYDFSGKKEYILPTITLLHTER